MKGKKNVTHLGSQCGHLGEHVLLEGLKALLVALEHEEAAGEGHAALLMLTPIAQGQS